MAVIRTGPCDNGAMRILVIRLSALGDIVHALPALTDLRRALPEATIDFAVDERFVDVARLHGGVSNVLPIALKRWKRHPGATNTWRELYQTLGHLRRHTYDLVLDLHGLNKSALLARLARSSLRIGPHPRFCGEWLAPRLYSRYCSAPGPITPVPRMRAFVADALGQTTSLPASYGLVCTWQARQSDQVVLAHSSSARDKLWPEAHWIALGQMLKRRGLQVLLPWGSSSEKERSVRLAQAVGEAAEVAPSLSIAQWAEKLSRCRLVIGVDTGLTHLAAAAGVPCAALFMATGAELFAPDQPQRARALGDLHQSPSLDVVFRAVVELLDHTR